MNPPPAPLFPTRHRSAPDLSVPIQSAVGPALDAGSPFLSYPATGHHDEAGLEEIPSTSQPRSDLASRSQIVGQPTSHLSTGSPSLGGPVPTPPGSLSLTAQVPPLSVPRHEPRLSQPLPTSAQLCSRSVPLSQRIRSSSLSVARRPALSHQQTQTVHAHAPSSTRPPQQYLATGFTAGSDPTSSRTFTAWVNPAEILPQAREVMAMLTPRQRRLAARATFGRSLPRVPIIPTDADQWQPRAPANAPPTPGPSSYPHAPVPTRASNPHQPRPAPVRIEKRPAAVPELLRDDEEEIAAAAALAQGRIPVRTLSNITFCLID